MRYPANCHLLRLSLRAVSRCRPTGAEWTSHRNRRVPSIRQTSTLIPRLREGIHSRPVVLQLIQDSRSVVKISLVASIIILTAQLSMHACLVLAEESRNPTSKDWPFVARYYLQRFRVPNAWNPIGSAQSEQTAKMYLDSCLAAIEPMLSQLQLQSESWRLEYLRLREITAQYYERQQRFTLAKREYEEMLAVPLGEESAHQTADRRMKAAIRLANIREWDGDEEGALAALRKAVECAWPSSFSGNGAVPNLPPVGSPGNTPTLIDAASELAIYYARHGQLAQALKIMVEVLQRRRAAPPVEDGRDFTTEISDPCKEAATMSAIGELTFALGKTQEGVDWTEKAYWQSWRYRDYRLACKECAAISATTLIQMGKNLAHSAGEKHSVWQLDAKRRSQTNLHESERLIKVYTQEKAKVDSIRAIKDIVTGEAAVTLETRASSR